MAAHCTYRENGYGSIKGTLFAVWGGVDLAMKVVGWYILD